MLIDKNCVIVLMALSKLNAANGYMIIDKEEIISSLEIVMPKEELNVAIMELANSVYIKIKFNDREEICLTLTELGRQTVTKLEKMRLKELSAKAIVSKNTQGETIVTTLDNSPIYDSPAPDVEVAQIEVARAEQHREDIVGAAEGDNLPMPITAEGKPTRKKKRKEKKEKKKEKKREKKEKKKEKKEKKKNKVKKPMGRFSAFVISIFGGMLGSGLLASTIVALAYFGII